MDKFMRQSGDYDGLKDDPEGDMMWYHDHVEAIGQMLADHNVTIRRLEAELKEAYTKGYLEGFLGHD